MIYFFLLKIILFFSFKVNSIEDIKILDLDLNLINLKSFYDVLLIKSGTQLFIAGKNQNNYVALNKYQVFDRNQGKNLKLMIDYFNSMIYILQLKFNIFYFPEWEMVGVYFIDQIYIVHKPIFNSTSGSQIGRIYIKINYIIHSPINNLIFYINSIGELIYQSKSDFLTNLKEITINPYNANLPYQLIITGMKLSKSQKLLAIIQTNTSNLYYSTIKIYNISLNSCQFFKQIAPNQIKINNAKIQQSIQWKNEQILYMVSKDTNMFCYYNINDDTNFCQGINTNEQYKIYYSDYWDRVILHATTNPSPVQKNTIISFHKSQNLSKLDNYAQSYEFDVQKTRFVQFSNTNIYLTQIGQNKSRIMQISKLCPYDQYYDTCWNQCINFHKFCIQNSTSGCNCKLNKNDVIITNIFNKNKNIIQYFIQNTIISILNKIPSIRGFSNTIYSFFINFNDLYMYRYHNRKFNYIIDSTLQFADNLQKQKLTFFVLNQIQSSIIQTFPNFDGLSTKKQIFTDQKFYKQQKKSNQFFVNMMNFIFPNFIVTLIIFITLRYIYSILKTFKIKFSQLLKLFHFKTSLILIVLQGNLQFFSYLFTFELKYLLSTNLFHKMTNCCLICIFFLIVLFYSSSSFFFKYLYKKSAKYFFDNSQNTTFGAFHFISNKGLRPIFLGITHCIVNNTYQNKIVLLIIIEIVFLIQYVVANKLIALETKIIAWIQIILIIYRVILLFIAQFLSEQQKDIEILILSCLLSIDIIIPYIFFSFLKMTVNFIRLLIQIYSLNNNSISVQKQSTFFQRNRVQWTKKWTKV